MLASDWSHHDPICCVLNMELLQFYYVLAGMTVGWQWYSVALPGWKRCLARKGVQDKEVEHLAHRAGLAWPGDATIGPFALHTTAAAVLRAYMTGLASKYFHSICHVDNSPPPYQNQPIIRVICPSSHV